MSAVTAGRIDFMIAMHSRGVVVTRKGERVAFTWAEAERFALSILSEGLSRRYDKGRRAQAAAASAAAARGKPVPVRYLKAGDWTKLPHGSGRDLPKSKHHPARGAGRKKGKAMRRPFPNSSVSTTAL